jgi:predicted XRE-type DNA-binding protein
MKERKEEHVEEISVTPATGNVFADLGLPEAGGLLVKSALALKISRIIEERHLSQAQALVMLGIAQSKFSLIRQGRLREVSLEELCRLLTLLGCDVDIVVKDGNEGGNGHFRVTRE